MAMKGIQLAILLLALGLATAAYTADRNEMKSVTFTVACYDVGVSTLKGRPGIISVQKGWKEGREINRVTFDPQLVSVQSMEKWLQEAGTYLGTEPELNLSREKEQKQ
ncbi:MAG: hypothetical protein KKD53_04040 [Proteobacteria bacterium]|nr:hypothetical protein [Pseudomonadota bacterium]